MVIKNHVTYENNKQALKKKEVKPVQPVQMTIHQSNTYRKNLSWLHFYDESKAQEDRQPCISVFAAYPKIPTRQDMTTVFHAQCMVARNLQKKKFHRTNQRSNCLGVNKENVRVLIQFRTESQPQYLKRGFFIKNRPIHFHINSTSVIRPVKQNQLSFSSIEIKKPLPVPVQCLIDQIQFQEPVLVVATDQTRDHTQRVVSSAQITIPQTTSSRRSLMFSRKSVGPRIEP